MKQLRVLQQFRDVRNFFTIHQEGDTITVDDERATRLVEGGLCEEIEQSNAEESDSPELETASAEVVEKPKRTRKRKEA
ncbi:MAG: hypothetical protein IJU90_05690 [Bacteroidales bacterium]|nr:hypothetical protein [Bacteroidales bacterium]